MALPLGAQRGFSGVSQKVLRGVEQLYDQLRIKRFWKPVL